MDPSVLKQDHHPYRRGERRRKPSVTGKAAPLSQEDGLIPRFLPRDSSSSARGVVLLVEPEASLRWSLGSALVHQGYSVAEVATLSQATALLRQAACDLVVLDLALYDGVDRVLLRSLIDATALTTPLVLLPARQPPVEQERFLLPGTAPPQPSWSEALLRVVERICPAPGPPESSFTPPEAEAREG